MAGQADHPRVYHPLTLIVVFLVAVVVAPAPTSAEGPQPEIELEFRLASETPIDGWEPKTAPDGRDPIYLAPEAVIVNADIERAWYEPMRGEHAVGILLTEAAGLRLARFSKQHIGEPVAIVVDDRVVSAPRIMAEIPGGRALVHGRFSEAEARTIADRLSGLNRQ